MPERCCHNAATMLPYFGCHNSYRQNAATDLSHCCDNAAKHTNATELAATEPAQYCQRGCPKVRRTVAHSVAHNAAAVDALHT